jgi:hypothetical protein
MTNDEANLKVQNSSEPNRAGVPNMGFEHLVFKHLDLIYHLAFGIRHSTAGVVR